MDFVGHFADGIAQRRNARDRRILAHSVHQSRSGRVLDVLGSLEVGLAGAKGDDVDTGGTQVGGFLRYGQGDRGLDT